jgi:hypothetical protein
MFSSEERWLIAGVLALLLLGGAVKLFRGHVPESTIEKVRLPGIGPASKVEAARQKSP